MPVGKRCKESHVSDSDGLVQQNYVQISADVASWHFSVLTKANVTRRH